MKKNQIRVAPIILDLKDTEQSGQEALFSLDDNNLLKLDQNEATVTPSPLVLETLIKTIESKSLNHHPDFASRRLRRRLSQYNGVGFDSIACFNSNASAIEAIVRTYLYPGLDVLISWPNDSLFAHYATSTGARVVQSQFNNPFSPIIEELIAGITSRTKLIYLNNPNNITGASLTDPEIVFLLSYASETMVVIDESQFEFSGLTLSGMISQYPNLIILRSFSKAFALAGIDVSYIMTDPQNLRFINRLSIGKYPGMLAQIAAATALNDTKYISMIVHQIIESKKMLFDTLTRLGYEFRISSANFFLIKVAKPELFSNALVKSNIFVRNLSNLPGFENYFRITIGTPAQTGVLLDILSQLADKQATGKSLIKNRISPNSSKNEYITN